MVRVISVHHFSRQDVSSCPRPTASTLAGSETLVLATDKPTIEVRNLADNARVSHSFQTVDRVSRVEYSPVGKYLATLEGLPGERGSGVRAYINWNDPRVDNAPIRPRIASRVTPSGQRGDAALDMVEFPQRDAAHQICVCPSTGNLLVGSANLLIIYKFTTKCHDATKSKYVDFNECFHVFHNFIPKELALSEDVVGCLSSNEIHIFKIKFSDNLNDERNLKSLSLYSFTSESEGPSLEPYPQQRRGSSGSDSEKDIRGAKINPLANVKNITLSRQQDSEASETHLEGYIGNVKRHPSHQVICSDSVTVTVLPEIAEANREFAASSGSGSGGTRIMEQSLGPFSPPLDRPTTVKCLMNGEHRDFEAECVTLIYAKLLNSEEGHESFKNLNIKPVYWKEMKVRGKKDQPPTAFHQPLHSAYHNHLMSHTACFTSNNEGYLYHLPGHLRKNGRGCGIQKIATYPFTGPVGEIAIEPTLLHALTETGLETYTLTSGHYTVLEAEKLDHRVNTCPGGDGSNSICLVGLRPFLATRRIMVSESRLVLLSSADQESSGSKAEDRNKWTVYCLKLPTAADLHRDMMQLANMNRVISPQGYLQLLSEAHLILRTACHSLAWHHQTAMQKEESRELNEAREKYRETCLDLARFSVGSNDAREWKLALPYFRMSQQPVPKLLAQIKDLAAANGSPLPPGTINYIKEIVLRPTPSEDVLEASVADEIIDMLGKGSPDTLASLVLESQPFRGFKSKKTLSFLRDELTRQQPTPDPTGVLAYSLLTVEQEDNDNQAREFLKLMAAQVSFSDLMIRHHTFLLEPSSGSFSELGLLLRDCIPEMFVEVLVSLIKAGIFPLASILQLFLGSFVSMSNIAGEAAQSAAMLQLFLETYFTEVISDAEAAQTSSSQQSLDREQEKALQTLVRSYLTSLTVPVRFGEKNIDADMFAKRHEFLDKLPPFLQDGSPKEVKKIMEDADSPDFWCQNSLLKLQSLLCSPLLGLPSCKGTVCSYLDVYPGVVGCFSLRVLSSELRDSLELLCQNHPDSILVYAKEHSMSEDSWRHVLTILQDQLSSASSDESPLHEAWYSAMQEILDYLAQNMDLEAFMKALPASADRSGDDFQGYIQMCRKNQQAADIQALIVNTGHKLLSTLTL